MGQFELKEKKKKKFIAEDGFDPSTSGLWAQHAPAAPLCYVVRYCCHSFISMNHMKMMQYLNSKVHSVIVFIVWMNSGTPHTYAHHTHMHTTHTHTTHICIHAHAHTYTHTYTHTCRHFFASVVPISTHPMVSTRKLWIPTSNPVVSFWNVN